MRKAASRGTLPVILQDATRQNRNTFRHKDTVIVFGSLVMFCAIVYIYSVYRLYMAHRDDVLVVHRGGLPGSHESTEVVLNTLSPPSSPV